MADSNYETGLHLLEWLDNDIISMQVRQVFQGAPKTGTLILVGPAIPAGMKPRFGNLEILAHDDRQSTSPVPISTPSPLVPFASATCKVCGPRQQEIQRILEVDPEMTAGHL